MPRYFFDIEAEQMHLDADGAYLPDEDACRQFAAGISDVISSGAQAPAHTAVWIRTHDGAVIDVLHKERQDRPTVDQVVR